MDVSETTTTTSYHGFSDLYDGDNVSAAAASDRIAIMSALRTAAQRVASRAAISSRVSTRTFASTSTIRNRDPALGDYPDVPPVSRQMRKWNKDWWDQQEKANFGETVSIFGVTVV